MAVNWLSVIPTVGSLLGSIGQGIFSAHSAEKSFERQRELWEYMQSNAHQLEVQDLKKAGLNPILSATNSQLAGMPSVGQARTPDNDLGQALSSTLNSALQASIQDKQVNADYDLGLKKIALERDRLKLQEQETAANVAYLEEQKQEVAERVKGIVIENSWKNKFKQADFDTKVSMIDNLKASTSKFIAEAGLTAKQSEKLSYQMKYGEFLIKYCPAKLLDTVVNYFDSLITDPSFESKFVDKLAGGVDVKTAITDYVDFVVGNRRGGD